MPDLVLDTLSKRFGAVAAVDGLSLTVKEGEFLSLLGPSGCGKSTTLQMIAGFIDPTGGAIRLDGRDIGRVRACDRGLGVVFQSYALFPHMTVAENVAFGLEMRRVRRDARARRVAQALALVRLDDLAQRMPAQLSGGQQQRVALARALVIEPPLLLLDEPLSNLDAKLREEMQLELRRIQREVGTTTLLVTHDQAEALALSDRVAVMRAGRIEQVGTPREVYEQPESTFVSSFLGKSNILAGAPIRTPAGFELEVGGRRIPAPPLNGHAGADRLLLSLRPERIRIAGGPTEDGLAGTVRARAFLGHHWVYQVDSALGALLVYRQSGSAAFAEGEAIRLSWDAEDLRVVDGGENGHA